MSWTPIFWITKEDFIKIENELKDYNVWNFSIADNEGYILTAGEFTSSYRELDTLLNENDIIHWLLDGESERCDLCQKWGRQIYEYTTEF